MENGWIKLHRKLLENPISKKPVWAWLWIVLLLKANHEDKKMIWNGDVVVIKEGQLVTGRLQLSKATGIPQTTIERILDYLENGHQIEQQKTTKYRLITIVNWKEHQERTAKRTTNGQQTDTNKNDKNDKNRTINSEHSSQIPIIIKEFEKINPACKRMYGNLNQRKACIDLIDTYGFDDVMKAIPFLPRNNTTPYKPKANTPLQLWQKWQDIKEAWAKEKLTTKNKPNFIL